MPKQQFERFWVAVSYGEVLSDKNGSQRPISKSRRGNFIRVSGILVMSGSATALGT
jgi:hypothetical protein